MPRISLKILLLFVSVTAAVLAPLGFLIRHSATWGPAERTENLLSSLYREASTIGNADVTIEEINGLLETPKYAFLKQHRAHNADLRDAELVRFSPNSKYSIGLTRDGSKLWIVNGQRVKDTQQ